MPPYQVTRADITGWLKEYEGPRFHAVLCDPPYALISIAKRFGPGQVEAQEGSDGRFRRLSGGFMGQEWDGFKSMADYQAWVAEWSRLMIEKALHPGAVCAFFGGTRTWHRLACGLEDGGFDVYDTFMWVYGQGFPKSHDISKFIDQQAGEERTDVEGPKPGHEEFAGRQTDGDMRFRGTYEGFDRPWMDDPEARERYHMKMKPATAAAERWDGYGTALKPAWEPVIICRAPRDNLGYADLALQHGTGALNIDGSRIEGPAGPGVWGTSNETINTDRKFNTSPAMQEYRSQRHQSGRWPANFGLVHDERCVRVGQIEGKARVINRWKDGMKPFGGGAGGEYETVHPSRQGEESADSTYEDKGGTNFAMKPGGRRNPETESVDLWACIPGCPVRELDDQAGYARSGGYPDRRHFDQTRMVYGKFSGELSEPRFQNTAGYVSRFYYCSKASRAERDLGLDDFYWRRTPAGWERVDRQVWEATPEKERSEGNIHPTVKPLDMLRYLARMMLPPELDGPRRLLVPFAGSGSEMIGARQAEWDEIVGVELSDDFAAIAEARLLANIGLF